jgi:hypothetical protein
MGLALATGGFRHFAAAQDPDRQIGVRCHKCSFTFRLVFGIQGSFFLADQRDGTSEEIVNATDHLDLAISDSGGTRQGVSAPDVLNGRLDGAATAVS